MNSSNLTTTQKAYIDAVRYFQDNGLVISYSKIARHLNVKTSTAKYMLDKLNEVGVLSLTKDRGSIERIEITAAGLLETSSKPAATTADRSGNTDQGIVVEDRS